MIHDPAFKLQEVDSLEAVIIIDNELDPLSPPASEIVQVTGSMGHIAMKSQHPLPDRGVALSELRMEDICCAAHGLSILVIATKADKKHVILFDTGPEEGVWEQNVTRLHLDLASVEMILLSHWHRDHSGGLLRAIEMVRDSRLGNLVVDVHPDRPEYRGVAMPGGVISFEADPKFDEIEKSGAILVKNRQPRTVLDDFFLISGEIPRVVPYEQGLKNSVRYNSTDEAWVPDEAITDERFLLCNLKGKGLVVFTGCSHAGVVNTVRNAVELGGKVPLHAAVGGFHLAMSDETQIQSTVSDLKQLDPSVLVPGHCSGWRAKFAIERQMPNKLVPCTVGTKIVF